MSASQENTAPRPTRTGTGDALESAIRAGDLSATVQVLHSMTPAERRARRDDLAHLGMVIQHSHWPASTHAGALGGEATAAQYRAFEAAMLVCGRPADLLDGPFDRTGIDAADWTALCGDFGIDAQASRGALQAAAEASLRDRPFHIVSVQRWVGAGLIDRPLVDDYTIGLIGLPRFLHWQSPGGMSAQFQRDPGLRDAVLRFFEVEGTGEHNLAAVDKYCKGPENLWSHLFLLGIAEGAYTRGQLLDLTLGTLAQDWPQFRAGWFSAFHKQLAPMVDEMAPRAEPYLALCQSRIPPTVTLALEALKALLAAQAVGEAALLQALPPVLSSSVKGQVEAALKLLDTVVKRQPARAREASAVGMAGLVQASADLQKKVLQRLAVWGMDGATRDALAEFLPGIAAVNRDALLALLGDGAAVPGAEAAQAFVPAPVPVVAQAVDPLDPRRALAPLTDLDELLDLTAFALENETDLDAFERVAEALVRLAPFTGEARKRFAPLVKRARKIGVEKDVAHELARLVLSAAQGERVASWHLQRLTEYPPAPTETTDARTFLARRMEDALDLSALGKGLSPLPSATHRRGFVDPAVLVARLAAHRSQGVSPSPLSQVLALLRLPTNRVSADALAAAQALPDTSVSRALRHALGEDGVPMGTPDCSGAAFELERDLFLAAARIRHPQADDPAVLAAFGDLGAEAALAARCDWRVETSQSGPYPPDTKVYTHYHLWLDTQPNAVVPPPNAVALHRCPVTKEGRGDWWSGWDFAGRSEAMVTCAAAMIPGALDVHFAGAAQTIGSNLRHGEAHWEHQGHLKLLLDPTVPFTPMAVLTLALSLGAKDPGLVALAVDALVHGHGEGRLDAGALGAALRRSVATQLVPVARYRKSLEAAVRAEPAVSQAVFGLLCDMLAADTESPPKDLASLMELLLELSLTLRRPLPVDTVAVLAALKLGGKGRALQKELLVDRGFD